MGVKSKIQCHVNVFRINPETVGPTAGANIMTSPIIPIALPRLCGGIITRMVLNISGKSKAVPTACTMRAIINTLNVGAIAPINVPIMENTRDAIKAVLL